MPGAPSTSGALAQPPGIARVASARACRAPLEVLEQAIRKAEAVPGVDPWLLQHAQGMLDVRLQKLRSGSVPAGLPHPPSLETKASIRSPIDPAQTAGLRRQLDVVLHEARQLNSGRKKVAAGGPKEPKWSIEPWLAGNTSQLVAHALQGPLRERVQPEERNEKLEERDDIQLDFVRALGKEGNVQLVLWIFEKANVLELLAQRVFQLAKELAKAEAATGEELNSKFMEDSEGTFEFVYGDTDEYFGGLEKLIGSPDPRVYEAMENDHCMQVDSNSKWETKNYGITTTPHTEWKFVSASSPRLDEWPKETINGSHPRKWQCLEDFRHKFDCINEKLKDKNEPKVRDEEWIGARLYTGPMFEKYNAVLRGGGFKKSPKEEKSHFETEFDRLCRGNRYVTTIHTINSALIKLSKLEKPQVLYRGMKGGRLPQRFWEGDARGGVERGFLSTSKKKTVAEQYTADGSARTILQLTSGMVDQGADLSPFSQYPHEEEICFPPLTCLEVLRSGVDGSCLVLDMRLNVNLTSDTIERVIAKRHKIVKSMCDHLYSEALRYLESHFWKNVVDDKSQVEAIQQAVGQLAQKKLREIHTSMPEESFNNDVVLLSAVKKALGISDSIKWMRSTVLLEAADSLRHSNLPAHNSAVSQAKVLKNSRGVTTVQLQTDDIRSLDLTGGSSTSHILDTLHLVDKGGILYLEEVHKLFPQVGKGFELLQVNDRRGNSRDLAREIVSMAHSKLEFLKQMGPEDVKKEVLKTLKGREGDEEQSCDARAMDVGRLLALSREITKLDLRGPYGDTTTEREKEKLSSEAGNTIMKAMENNWTLRSLLLCNNHLDASTARIMGSCLKNNYTLRCLNIGNNKLGEEGAKGIKEVLMTTVTIDTLRVRENEFGPHGAKAVAEGLKKNTSLQMLYIERNNIGQEGGTAFADCLRENKTLQALHIDGNSIGPQGGKDIADALKEKNKGLLTLWMVKNDLKEEGGKAFAEALRSNRTLKALGLSCNDMMAEGSIAIAVSLKENPTLEHLELEQNHFQDPGGKALAEALKVNQSLRVLRIQKNNFTHQAIEHIQKALSGHNTSLQRLSVDGNKVGLDGAESIAKTIAAHECPLLILNIHSCGLGSEGGKNVAKALERNAKLSTLTIHENELGDEAGAELAAALAKNSTLRTLKMHDNSLGPLSVKALASALEKNSKLVSLTLNGHFGEDESNDIKTAWTKERNGGLEWKAK